VDCGGVNFVRSIIWRWVHCSVGSEGAGWKAQGQSEAKRLVEVKLAGIQRNGSGAGTCTLEVVDLYNKLFHQHELVPVPLPADAVCKAQQFVSADSWFLNP
jgi:hypothetical protein